MIQWENDTFGGGTDRDYTNGIQIGWVSGDLESDQELPGVVRAVTSLFPGASTSSDVYRARFVAGQAMFTPSNMLINPPDPNDRPYAGWLYGGAGIGRFNENTADILQLNLGMVGPSSLADDTQDFVHNLLNTTDPQGWDYQLHDEFAFVLSYQKRWMWGGSLFSGVDWDASAGPGIVVGTVYDYVNATGTVRIGYNLTDTLPIETIGAGRSLGESLGRYQSADHGFSAYLLVGLDGRGIARNLFLDGNTFRSSRSVDKEYFVGEAHFGAGLSYDNISLEYLATLRSKEFKTQVAPQWFGNFTLSCHF